MTTLDEISALTRPNHPDDWTELDSAAVDTVRVLAADAVQKVGNGHPGTAMSLAPLAYTLFQRQMRHDPGDEQQLDHPRLGKREVAEELRADSVRRNAFANTHANTPKGRRSEQLLLQPMVDRV